MEHKTKQLETRKPFIDAGVFTIFAIADDPLKGMQFETRSIVRKEEVTETKPGLLLNSPVNAELKGKLVSAMHGEILFKISKIIKNWSLQDKLSAVIGLPLPKSIKLKLFGIEPDKNPDTVNLQYNKFIEENTQLIILSNEKKLELSSAYTSIGPKLGVRNADPKVGLREIEIDGNVIHADITPIQFPVYNSLASRATLDNVEISNLAELSGTAGIIFTAPDSEGNKKIILQYRSPKNASYKGIPCASAAGLFEFKIQNKEDSEGNSKKTFMPITGEDVKKHMLIEAEQELGIKSEDVSAHLLGIAHDQIKPHHEFMFVGELTKTEDELKGIIPLEHDPYDIDFKERYITIDANPESIETLLTQVKCPLSPTHAAAFLLAGYYLVAKKSDSNTANAWLKTNGQKVKYNYQAINELVKKYRSTLELKPNNISEDQFNEMQQGYVPSLLPEQQGLPNLFDELKRTNLIGEEMFIKLTEKHKQVA